MCYNQANVEWMRLLNKETDSSNNNEFTISREWNTFRSCNFLNAMFNTHKFCFALFYLFLSFHLKVTLFTLSMRIVSMCIININVKHMSVLVWSSSKWNGKEAHTHRYVNQSSYEIAKKKKMRIGEKNDFNYLL